MPITALQTALFASALIATAFSQQWTCPEGYILKDDMCYYFNGDTVSNFDEALEYCEDNGDSLVSIHTEAVNSFISEFNGVIIGLRYFPETQSYNWTDGTPVDFTSYDENFVAWRDFFGYCAKNVRGKWSNFQCETEKLRFVCQDKAVPATTTKSSSCPDPNIIYKDQGTNVITSPDYPAKYDLRYEIDDCFYKLAARNNEKIRLDFTTVSMAEGMIYVYKKWVDTYEYVQVDHAFAGKTLIVDSNLVKLRLVGSPTGRFKITWTATTDDQIHNVTTACPMDNLIYVPPVTLFSPGYPNAFNVGPFCNYYLTAKYNYNMKLAFEQLHFDPDNGYVNVYSNWGRSSDGELKYDSKNNSQSHVFDSNHVLVEVTEKQGYFKIDVDTVSK